MLPQAQRGGGLWDRGVGGIDLGVDTGLICSVFTLFCSHVPPPPMSPLSILPP